LDDPDLGVITYRVDPLAQVREEVGPVQRVRGETTSIER
jgi:hypothetical protein